MFLIRIVRGACTCYISLRDNFVEDVQSFGSLETLHTSGFEHFNETKIENRKASQRRPNCMEVNMNEKRRGQNP